MHESLNRAEEMELTLRMRAGDAQANTRLARSVLPFAIQVATGDAYAGKFTRDELESVAGMAIAQALQTFDPGKGRLTTYVYYAVRTEMRKELQFDGVIHVPPEYFKEGRSAPFRESAEQARRVLSINRTHVRSGKAREALLAEVIPDPAAASPPAVAECNENARILNMAFEKGLAHVQERSPKSAIAIRMRHEGATLKEIGQQLGVKYPRVQQMLARWVPEMQAVARSHCPPSLRPDPAA